MRSLADSLDYRPLAAATTFDLRLRAIGANPQLVLGLVLGTAMAVGAPVVGLAELATGTSFSWGGLVAYVLTALAGAYVVVMMFGQAAPTTAAFARANRLHETNGAIAPGYAGSRFADRSWLVEQSVQTVGHALLEVGNCFPATGKEVSLPRLFLRARLAGGVDHDPAEGARVPAELDRELEILGGPYVVELTDDELTVFATRRLSLTGPEPVRKAFELVERLAGANERGPRSAPDPTAVGRAAASRGRHPLVVALGVVAVLAAGVVAAGLAAGVVFAVVPDEDTAGRVAVVPAVVALVAVVRWGVRRLLTPPRRGSAS